jgi:pSer/pThr/pTyr-binding forkhead associated (FHA) protein
MEKTYTVGRGSSADLRTPKSEDAVGKVHLELTDLGGGRVRIRDLASTNGTFLRVAGKWQELRAAKAIGAGDEIMLGDYVTTPRALLALAPPPAPSPAKADTEPPPIPAKRPRLRRNEFGEIVRE